MSKAKNTSLHNQHRERTRNRANVYGFESFSDHEILELALYPSNPRGNTNETAHRLIERFGSFAAVLSADAEALQEVEGVGTNTAFHLSLTTEIMRRYARSMLEEPRTYDNVQQIAEYIWSRFAGLEHERLYAMLFDNRMSLISLIFLSEGTVNSTNVPKAALIKEILRKNASCVVLAHNHPHGIAKASEDDVQVTNDLYELLGSIGVPLREHLILTEKHFRSIMREHCRFPRVYSEAGKRVGDRDFDWDTFYNVDEDTYTFPMPGILAGAENS